MTSPPPLFVLYVLSSSLLFFLAAKRERDREMPKNNTTYNDSSHQSGRQNRVPITSSDTDGNEKQSK